MIKQVAGSLALAFGVSLAAQQVPTPIFKTSIDAVTLDVRVVDRSGKFVKNLTTDDFTVLEDGRPQEIATFSEINIPVRTERDAPIQGRLYVLLLDDLRTNPGRTADVRAQARDFLDHHFSGTDRAVVLTTSGRVRRAQDFTTDRERLLQAVEQYSADVGSVGRARCENGGVSSYECAANDDRAALASINSVATWLGTIPGQRKAVLLFGEGLSFDQAANVLGPDPTTATGFQGDEASGDPRLTPGSIRLNRRVTEAEGAYRTVAPVLVQAAGAAARANVTVYELDPRRHPENSYQKIVDDMSSYYLLGYVPTNTKHDGTFRKLEVRTRRADLHVQARTGYTTRNDAAPTRVTDVSSALADLMSAPIQVSGLTMGAMAAAFAGAGSKASVEVIVDIAGRELTAASDPGGKGSLDLLLAVTDADGRVETSERGSLAMNLSAPTRDAVAQHGLRVLSRLAVPPGHYLLRVAGIDGGGNSKGSVQYDLDVPDFTKAALAMSGLALAAGSELERPTTGSDNAWRERFAQPPTAAREFGEGDSILVSGEIYRNDPQLADIVVTTQVKSASGDVVFEREQTLDGTSGAASPLRHQTMIPLQGLDVGDYLLVVAASNSSDATVTASRQMSFVVRPAAAIR